MKHIDKLLAQGSRIQYIITSNNKKPKKFGTQYLLYHSEIHFIDAVELGDGLNVSQLSEKLGVTHGAVSQIAGKLIKKKLIEKYKKEGNQKEVYIKLTSHGEIAYKNHKKFHNKFDKRLKAYLNSLSDTQIEVIFGLLDTIEQNIPNLGMEESK